MRESTILSGRFPKERWLPAVPEDSELPCHRVVTKDGNVSCAFSGGICNRQMELLKKEGVGFIDDHVDMRRFQWSKRLF